MDGLRRIGRRGPGGGAGAATGVGRCAGRASAIHAGHLRLGAWSAQRPRPVRSGIAEGDALQLHQPRRGPGTGRAAVRED